MPSQAQQHARGPRRGVRPWTRWTREQQTWQAEDRGRGGLEVDAPASLRLLRARGPSPRLAKATAREQGERRPQAALTVALAPVASSGVRTSHFLCRLAVGPQGKATDGALSASVAGSRARGLAVSSRRRPLVDGTTQRADIIWQRHQAPPRATLSIMLDKDMRRSHCSVVRSLPPNEVAHG